MSSRYSSAGGSRYPSAYGHTPSYRSYVKGDIGVDAAYPSALGEKILLVMLSIRCSLDLIPYPYLAYEVQALLDFVITI